MEVLVYEGARKGVNTMCSGNSGQGVLWVSWALLGRDHPGKCSREKARLEYEDMLKFSLGDFELTLKWRNTLGW